MVIDTSALLAVLLGEEDGEAFAERIASAADPRISAGTLVEASIVMHARIGEDGVRDLDDLLAAAGVRCVAVDRVQARTAREGFTRYGRGQAPAGLNLGDCFAYALAKVTGSLLLFKGRDLAQTDVSAAMPAGRST